MGNIASSNKKAESEFENFYDIIDYIATYYILTSDFNSLRKLTEKEYCDKLVILTSDIIKRYFTDLEVTYLAQRIKDGIEVNDLTKDNIIFLNKDKFVRDANKYSSMLPIIPSLSNSKTESYQKGGPMLKHQFNLFQKQKLSKKI